MDLEKDRAKKQEYCIYLRDIGWSIDKIKLEKAEEKISELRGLLVYRDIEIIELKRQLTAGHADEEGYRMRMFQ